MSGTSISCPQGFFQDSSVSPEVIADLESTIATANEAAATIATSTAAAAASATAAAASATAASGSQSAAATSATAAAASASTATSGASTATSQATAAASSATAAATSASSAATSVSTAASSATAASGSATAAANSATASATSATAAAGSASGASSSAAAASTSATAAAASAASIVPLAGFRNVLINGAMDYWQRGTNNIFSGSISTNAYTADRWQQSYDGSGSVTTVTTTGSLPQALLDLGFSLCYSTSITTAGSGGTFRWVGQPIENVRTLSGRQVTLSFWAKADASRTISAALSQNFGSGGSPSSPVNYGSSSLSVTTSWQKFAFTTTLGSISGKTLGSNGDSKLYVLFNLPINTTLSFQITGVQLEASSASTSFDWRPPQVELGLCQRYYQLVEGFQWYGTSTGSGANAATPVLLPVKMRTTPTVALGTITYGNASSLSVTGVSSGVAVATLNAAAAGPFYGFGTAAFNAEL